MSGFERGWNLLYMREIDLKKMNPRAMLLFTVDLE